MYYIFVNGLISALLLYVLVYLQCGILCAMRCSKMVGALVLSGVAFLWLISNIAVIVGCTVHRRELRLHSGRRIMLYFSIMFSGLCAIAWYVVYLRLQSNGKEFFADNLCVPPGLEVLAAAPQDAESKGFETGDVTNVPPFMFVTEPLHICYGAVNPRMPGDIYIRMIDAVRNLEICQTGNRVCRWSENGEENFCFRFVLGPNPGRRGRTYVIRYELWFRSKDGTREWMLLSKTYTTEGIR